MSEPEPPAKKPRRRLSARKRLLFALLTLGVLFGVPEAFCQVREVVRASRKPRLPVEDCPYRITRLTPGARVVREGQTISINSFGLRGPELTQEKPAGALRVACVGASTTFGLYAKDDASTWPALLERSLRAKGRQVEVLNCGAPGWTSRASSRRPARVAGCSGSSGWRTASERITPPSIITALQARRPHCRFS